MFHLPIPPAISGPQIVPTPNTALRRLTATTLSDPNPRANAVFSDKAKPPYPHPVTAAKAENVSQEELRAIPAAPQTKHSNIAAMALRGASLLPVAPRNMVAARAPPLYQVTMRLPLPWR
ncbi:hypothetical protein GCM10018772_17260 [Streptomyces fumanus]|uniref:Uncharacterized protein n=1 Tax=Streptomyces fumanus TaxID=67302 RepID=A0A919AA25_9ACTN|nr:hypothetical protein GCM10018772_17260 [Streptomyces fumanus]